MFRASFCLMIITGNVDAEALCMAVTDSVSTPGRSRFVSWTASAFGSAKAISSDYAVLMEKDISARRRAGGMRWYGWRLWHAVWELSRQGIAGAMPRRVLPCSRDLTELPMCRGDRALVALEGVDDLIVGGRTPDAVLVSRQRKMPTDEGLVAKLKTMVRQVPRNIQWRHRPWGAYQSISTWASGTGQAHRGEAGRPAIVAKA